MGRAQTSIPVTMNPTKPARFYYRLGANQPAASPTARRLAEMAEAIFRDTDGELRLDVFPESRLGPDPQMFADLRAGTLEFFLSARRSAGWRRHQRAAADAVCFSRHRRGVRRAGRRARRQHPTASFAVAGLLPSAASWQNGFHHITNDVRPIETAADFAG